MSQEAHDEFPRLRTMDAPDSGLFRVGAHPRSSSTERDVALQVRALVAEFAVLLMPSCGRGARVILSSESDSDSAPTSEPEDLGFPVALRLGAWLGEACRAGTATILPVPVYVRDWIRGSRAFVIPLTTRDWSAGAIVVPVDGLSSQTARALRDLGPTLAQILDASHERDGD